MKACTCEQMRKIDSDTEKLGGIPSIVLMENAAFACVREIENVGIMGKRAAVFCGKGNNGGDGLAIARLLHNRGADVTVYLVCGHEYKGDALINYEIVRRMGIKTIDSGFEKLSDMYVSTADICVDAVFGTGIHGIVTGAAEHVINSMNRYGRYVLSVDIPSGINGDTGAVCGVCAKPDITVTFGAYKLGMVMFPGCEHMGRIVVSDISIPQNIIDAQNIKTNIMDEETAAAFVPARHEDSHKGDYGKVLVIGGSVGMTGAPAMASQAALVCGAGLVTAAIPETLNPIMEVKLTEVMTLPLRSVEGALSLMSTDQIEKQMDKADVILFGPGAGRGEDIYFILENIIKTSQVPLIIDADGINALSEKTDILKEAECDIILTPHSAEMSRICGKSISEIESDRHGISREFAKKYGITLILKGHHTIVTGPDGTQYISITGNSGMATGGSGDVLAGMIASFAARGLDCTEAAALAVYLHGDAGDEARDELGADSVTATDIIRNIPYSIRKIMEK